MESIKIHLLWYVFGMSVPRYGIYTWKSRQKRFREWTLTIPGTLKARIWGNCWRRLRARGPINRTDCPAHGRQHICSHRSCTGSYFEMFITEICLINVGYLQDFNMFSHLEHFYFPYVVASNNRAHSAEPLQMEQEQTDGAVLRRGRARENVQGSQSCSPKRHCHHSCCCREACRQEI